MVCVLIDSRYIYNEFSGFSAYSTTGLQCRGEYSKRVHLPAYTVYVVWDWLSASGRTLRTCSTSQARRILCWSLDQCARIDLIFYVLWMAVPLLVLGPVSKVLPVAIRQRAACVLYCTYYQWRASLVYQASDLHQRGEGAFATA